MYLGGKYVKENEKFAVKLYFRALDAANQPETDDFCRPDIMMRIGELFLEGLGVERSPKRALDCLMQALSGFYERRKTDPFVADLIERVKGKIREAEESLDDETL